METIRIGGVPEHFNYPWHYCIANDVFTKHGIDLKWEDVKGGSGAMCKKLDNQDLDVALVLTEGIVKSIHTGSESRIIQQYVKSPLVWGVHSAKDRNLNVNDLGKARIARSRFGSGSHLMAYVHAEQKGYHITEENFVTVGNIDGAMSSFQSNESDIILWEKFMTQPYVDNNVVNRIGLCVSPWPCFMMVGNGAFVKSKQNVIKALGKAIIEAIQLVAEDEKTPENIAQMYKLELDQVKMWYSTIEWQTSSWVSKKMLNNVTNTLNRVGLLVNEPLPAENLCVSDCNLY